MAEGRTPHAALEAVRLRLRPILMTSLAFGLGVLPLAMAHGAGSARRTRSAWASWADDDGDLPLHRLRPGLLRADRRHRPQEERLIIDIGAAPEKRRLPEET